MKKIIVGSLNETKVDAVKKIFPEYAIAAVKAPSNVLAQPIGDEMTRMGAINRARFAKQSETCDYGIGFEGGVTFIGGKLFLCNWGALVGGDDMLFTASAFHIPLPDAFIEPILAGKELGDLIEAYSKRRYSRTKEGAIGLFTNELVVRNDIYVHIATLLKGQLLYAQKN